MIGGAARRRETRVASIVATAWELAGDHGIGGVSLHALAREVGIRQPSLYAYFDSKHALYDAMFADGNRQLLERLEIHELVIAAAAEIPRRIEDVRHAAAHARPPGTLALGRGR